MADKSLGTAIPVLLFIALLCWAALVYLLTGWVGRELNHARGTDRMMLQLFTGGAALLLWILLGGVLLLMGVKGALPGGMAATAWLVHGLSCAAALAAIALMYAPELRWPAAVATVPPILVAAFALYSFFPALPSIPPRTVGFAVWGAILALSLSITPEILRWRAAHADDSIDATPGPKLDAWTARQRERRRQDGLAELSKVDEETTLMELSGLIVPDSPVRAEALAAMRRLPARQAEMIRLLLYFSGSFALRVLPEIEIQPTPELCDAALSRLRRELSDHRKMFSEPRTFDYPILQESLPGIVWLVRNCEACKPAIAELEAFALTQLDSPGRQQFLGAIAAAREK